MLRRFVAWVVSHHWPLVALAACITIGATLGAARIGIDFSSSAFYGDDSRAERELEAFTARFGADDRTLVVVVHAQDGESLTTLRHASALRGIESALQAVAEVERTIGPSSWETARTVFGIEALRELEKIVWSKDRTHAAIIAPLAIASDDMHAAREAVAKVEQALEPFESGDLQLGLAGVPAIRAAFIDVTLRDQARFVPATIAIIGLGLFAIFGRIHAVLVPLLAALFPLLLLVGTMGWTGEPIGLLNQSLFTLIPVLAVTNSIHLLVRAYEARHRLPRREAVIEATVRTGRACFATSVTTGAAFASMALADMPVLRSFGLYAALGIAYAFVTTIVFVPLSLRAGTAPALAPRFYGWMKLGRWLARAVMGHPKRSIAAMVVLTASLAAFGTKPTIDNRLGRLLDEDHPVRQASQRVDRELSGILSIEIEFVAPAPWSASQWQDALSPFEAWARDQPRVGAVLGPSLPAPIRDAVPIVASTRQHARVSLRVPDIGGRAFSELRVQVERAATQTGLPATLTGTTAVAYEGVDRITRELFVSLTTAMVLVAAILVALIRKPAIAAVALIVNAVPLALATWLMGRLAPQQDPVSTVILTLAIGIAVDDTIHLLERYREQRATGDSPRRAAATALQRGGVPVLITSLVLAVGLAINLGSSFPALALLGALGTSVILLATAFDIVLLPVLVSWVDGVRTDATGADTDRR